MLIALIGFTGAGKSTLGRTLRTEYGLPCYDSDALIEARLGYSVTQCFAIEGEESFRRIERDVIADVLQTAHLGVLVTGGGAVLADDTRMRIMAQCYTVCVSAPLDVIWERLRNDTKRPLLQGENPRKRLEELLQERQGMYDIAHTKVESGDPVEAASKIMAGWLRFALNGCTV